jgi:hypothetical protein
MHSSIRIYHSLLCAVIRAKDSDLPLSVSLKFFDTDDADELPDKTGTVFNANRFAYSALISAVIRLYPCQRF